MTTITLKKAAEISRLVLEAANKIKLAPTIGYSIYSTAAVETVIEQAGTVVVNALSDVLDLTDAHFKIRAIVGEANTSAGINVALNERANLDAVEKRLNTFLSSVDSVGDIVTKADEIENRLLSARSSSTDRYSYESSITLCVVPEEVYADLRKRLATTKRERSDLTDKIAGINLNTRVTLPDDVVIILKKHGILA